MLADTQNSTQTSTTNSNNLSVQQSERESVYIQLQHGIEILGVDNRGSSARMEAMEGGRARWIKKARTYEKK